MSNIHDNLLIKSILEFKTLLLFNYVQNRVLSREAKEPCWIQWRCIANRVFAGLSSSMYLKQRYADQASGFKRSILCLTCDMFSPGRAARSLRLFKSIPRRGVQWLKTKL